MHPFSTPPSKNIGKTSVFWYFQGVEDGCIRNKWVDSGLITIKCSKKENMSVGKSWLKELTKIEHLTQKTFLKHIQNIVPKISHYDSPEKIKVSGYFQYKSPKLLICRAFLRHCNFRAFSEFPGYPGLLDTLLLQIN